nr:serine/threonine-protein kinase [Streptomyces sp. CBMA152]
MLDVESVDLLEPFLDGVGNVFQAFREQDSGCVSYGVAVDGERWFVKSATTPAGVASLRRALAVHRAVRHPAIVPLRHSFRIRGGLALVYLWVDGTVLYHPTVSAHGGRTAWDSPMARFHRLPLPQVLAAVNQILDAHLAVEQAGFVAVDFYDGCMLYDFTTGRLALCDVDEYRPGPFTLTTDRLPGSRRYMAPEEFRQGATIEIRTTVYVLGRALRLLLDAGDQEQQWRGTAGQLAVTARATAHDPGQRYATVAALTHASRATTITAG